MTTSISTTEQNTNFEKEWWVGNIRTRDASGLLLGAHLAHAGLMALFCGSFTLKEVAEYSPGLPLAEQGFTFLPHLAAFGISVGPGGDILDTYPYFCIGVLHLTFAAVYAAGGLYHIFVGSSILSEDTSSTRASKFHYDWDNPKKLSFILGHHLIFLGVACLAFAVNAKVGSGIYDPTEGAVRQISNPNLDIFALLGYIFGFTGSGWSPFGMAAVDNMETVIGGHLLVGCLEILGGIFHIVTQPFALGARSWSFSGEAILSYSLAALGLMGLSSSLFVAHCSLVYPPEFYGADRIAMVNIQLLLAICCYGGHIWHGIRAQRASG